MARRLIGRLLIILLGLLGHGRFHLRDGLFLRLDALLRIARTVEERIIRAKETLGALQNVLESHENLLSGNKGMCHGHR